MVAFRLMNRPAADRLPQEILDIIFGFVYDTLDGIKIRWSADTRVTQEALCQRNFGLLFVSKLYSRRFQHELYKRAQVCLPDHVNIISLLRSCARLDLIQHAALPRTMEITADAHPRIVMRLLMGALSSIKTLEFRVDDISLARSGLSGLNEDQIASRLRQIVEEILYHHMDPESGSEDRETAVAPIISCYETASNITEALFDNLFHGESPDPDDHRDFRLTLSVRRCMAATRTPGYSQSLLRGFEQPSHELFKYNVATRHEVTGWTARGKLDGDDVVVCGTTDNIQWYPRPRGYEHPWTELQAMGLAPLYILQHVVLGLTLLTDADFLMLTEAAPSRWLNDSPCHKQQYSFYQALCRMKAKYFPAPPDPEPSTHGWWPPPLNKYQAYRFFKIFLKYRDEPVHAVDWEKQCPMPEFRRLATCVTYFNAQKRFFIELFGKQGTPEAEIVDVWP